MPDQQLSLLAGGLTLVRVGVALRLSPFLGGRPLPWLAWAALSLAVTLALWPVVGRSPIAPDGAPHWVVLGLREALIGAAFGLAARLAFGVLESAGGLLSAAALAYPPERPAQDPPGASLSGLFVLFGTAAFLLVGGHHALLGGLASSLRCLPVATPLALEGGLDRLLDAGLALFGGAFAWAVMIAAPVYVAGLIAEATVGLVSRAVTVFAQPGVTGGLRVVAVQLSLIAVLGGAVSVAVEFLQAGLDRIASCGG